MGPFRLDAAKKKPTWLNPSEGFDHVGLLFNQPPGTARLPFNESSELEFCDATEPIPNRHRLRTAGIIPFGTREVTQRLSFDGLFAVFVRTPARSFSPNGFSERQPSGSGHACRDHSLAVEARSASEQFSLAQFGGN